MLALREMCWCGVSPPAEAFVGVVSVDDQLVQNLQRRDGDLLLLLSSSLLLLPCCSLQHLLQHTAGPGFIKKEILSVDIDNTDNCPINR